MKNQILVILPLLLIAFLANAQDVNKVFSNHDLNGLKRYVTPYNIDSCYKGLTLLTASVKYGNKEFVEFLLKEGAGIDERCMKFKKRSAIMLAAAENRIDLGQLLMKYDPDLKLKDFDKQTVFDIARNRRNYEFIEKVLGNHLDQFGDVDGPYVQLIDDQIETIYFKKNKDGQLKLHRELTEMETASGKQLNCYSTKGEKLFDFKLNFNLSTTPAVFSDEHPIYAVSDIEGNYDAFANLLKAGNVVDDEMNWKFGQGHLVLVGDFFDRGDEVTQCMWLIYKLEQEALAAGGYVHFVLGNHEEMNLNGDLRYVKGKYLANAKIAGLDYGKLYDDNCLLGQWLRTKNAMLKIGPNLFCHAGLSPEFFNARIKIKTVNKVAREYLCASDSVRSTSLSAAHIFAPTGPLWYRGLNGRKVSDKQLNKILKFYGAKKIIIGHSVVEKVQPLYDGRVINIDVPHKLGPKRQKALLIDQQSYYEVNTQGEKRLIE